MTDDLTVLTDRLARLAGTAAVPAEATVGRDVARGRTALVRRRRTRAAMAGVGLTLTMGAGLGVLLVAQDPVDGGRSPAAGPSQGGPTTGDSSTAEVALVSYSGRQPEGFTVAKVPAGFVVQGSDAFVLTLAPTGDSSHYLSFADKLVVTLQSLDAAPGAPEGTPVEVDGEPGAIREAPDGLARTLSYVDGDRRVEIQAWRTVGLTDDQLVEFAEGIGVTGAAQAPRG
ncbi:MULTISPECIES: hypothetical protein [Nocardioides]|uniref:DUF4367 domain-containing protein n=1 Tax=Nocardioides vastitatis TaxID=2568655 RepID=A0ABW0ZR46_9ACTN|nr:hypothetical protein [Nocardioides sp.]THI96051.1 hypothetical protein E7Z54_17710 [Nocardioides sp.]